MSAGWIGQDDLHDLAVKGWLCRVNACPVEIVTALRENCLEIWERQGFAQAGIGSGLEHRIQHQIRGDLIHWWDKLPENVIQKGFEERLEGLRQDLNRAFFLALHDMEIQYSLYPPGTAYKRHLDQFRSRSNRQISIVFYLNDNWQSSWGGQLRMYVAKNQKPVDILPEAGTLVLFRSDQIPHEVMVTSRQRLAISGWFKNRG